MLMGIILGAHGFFVFHLFIEHSVMEKHPVKKQPIHVTVKESTACVERSSPVKKTHKPLKPRKVQPVVKPPLPKKIEKQVEPVRKKIEKKPILAEGLADELEKQIARIERPSIQTVKKEMPSSHKEESALLSSLQVEKKVDSREEMKKMISQELREALHLPDYGEVKARIFFQSDGSISKVEVLKSDSTKNSDYLLRELPKKRFPSFVKLPILEGDMSFVIHFYNEV